MDDFFPTLGRIAGTSLGMTTIGLVLADSFGNILPAGAGVDFYDEPQFVADLALSGGLGGEYVDGITVGNLEVNLPGWPADVAVVEIAIDGGDVAAGMLLEYRPTAPSVRFPNGAGLSPFNVQI